MGEAIFKSLTTEQADAINHAFTFRSRAKAKLRIMQKGYETMFLAVTDFLTQLQEVKESSPQGKEIFDPFT